MDKEYRLHDISVAFATCMFNKYKHTDSANTEDLHYFSKMYNFCFDNLKEVVKTVD